MVHTMSGNKIRKTWCFSSDLCEKIKGYALMENKSETQFVTDCITSYINHKIPADSFASELKKLQIEIKRLGKKFGENETNEQQ